MIGTVDDYEAVILPGGVGALSNLCTLGASSVQKVNEDIKTVLFKFHAAKKPIGMCGVSLIIAGMVFSSGVDEMDGKIKDPIKITLGSGSTLSTDETVAKTIEKIKQMRINLVECNTNEICVDQANKIVTTPAFMHGSASFHDIHDGIKNMVNKLADIM